MLLQGLAGMCVFNFLTGIFSYTESNPWLIVASILIFCCFFESSLGTVLFIYLSETIGDQAVGIAISFIWVVTCIVVATLPSLVSPSVLDVYGTFFLYGTLCMFGFIFILIMLPESKKKVQDMA
jgi:SP family sugar porter-like MFS transporter